SFAMLYGQRIGEIWLPDTLMKLRTNVGKAVIAGVESYIELNLPKAFGISHPKIDWSVFTNTAFIYSRYIASPFPYVKGNEVEFIPTLNTKIGSQAKYKAFKSSLQFSYLSDQYTDADNSVEPDHTATVGL